MTDRTAARLRFTAGMLALPLAMTIAAVAWALSVMPRLPDPMATHFWIDLSADGFASPGELIASAAGAAIVTAVVFGAMTMTGLSSKRAGKIFAGFGAGFVALCPLMLIALVRPQLGLADASGFGMPVADLSAALVASVIIGLVVGVLVRPAVEPDDTVPAAEPISVTESTRAAWFGRGRASWVLVLVMGIATIATAAPAAFAIRDGETGPAIGLGATAVVMALLGWMFAVVRVRVDATGVRWSLGPGFPRSHIEYDSIRSVSAVELRAGDWGGWGYRIGGMGTAILLRGGEGLRIEKTGGKALYVSVDDAARGAALAQAHLAR
ncbi:DUF1648 domain-containing protein [uncultured Corynebacterium sp.]|uniref:DUF1648 domain-containing protein n=1 Tax=uncultured Corynebacterium sp. TaxID=159447 RepID=UPI0025D17F19|nr:DUF1648 domain-containing protein [uncultured Corynebacterium sp.]